MVKIFEQAEGFREKLGPVAKKIELHQLNQGPAPTQQEIEAATRAVNEYYDYLIDVKIPYGQTAKDVANNQHSFGRFANKYFEYQGT